MKKTSFSIDELRYVSEAVASGDLAGDGAYSQRCHALLEKIIGSRKCLLTTSGAGALELAGMLLRLEPGDEVIFPAFSSSATVSPFLLRGVRPVFVDIRPDRLTIDERLIEEKINARTRAIVVSSYAGIGAEMDVILQVVRRHGLKLVEENAYGLFGTYRGRPLGSFGVLATQSFHQSLAISSGEGGALLVNDPYFVARAETLRGGDERGTWDTISTRYIPSEIISAYLLSQLETRDAILARRQEVWDAYARELGAPATPSHMTRVPSQFHFIASSSDIARDLVARGLGSAHFPALHLTALGRRFGGRAGDCPVAERMATCLVRLPLHAGMTAADAKKIVAAMPRRKAA